MKIALITTTIYVPRVLERYRALDRDVVFFVAGDRETPHAEARAFIDSLGNAAYYSDADQEKLGYKCSEIIGWNKIMRRNIALLEAIRWGAEIVVSVDDDNIPLDNNYFNDFRSVLSSPFNGVKVTSASKWFNAGELLCPKIYHRGFPYDVRREDVRIRLTAIKGARVGVAAGLWLGDPDVDAMERITTKPWVHDVSEVLRRGLIVDHECQTPFSSQNTAYVTALAPLMMVLVGVGRYDDIWASYIAQHVMAHTDYHIHFGKPFVWQERHPHNLWQNLKDEIFGMEYTGQFCQDLRAMDLGAGDLLTKLRRLYERLKVSEYVPRIVHELGVAWADDVEKVLSR